MRVGLTPASYVRLGLRFGGGDQSEEPFWAEPLPQYHATIRRDIDRGEKIEDTNANQANAFLTRAYEVAELLPESVELRAETARRLGYHRQYHSREVKLKDNTVQTETYEERETRLNKARELLEEAQKRFETLLGAKAQTDWRYYCIELYLADNARDREDYDGAEEGYNKYLKYTKQAGQQDQEGPGYAWWRLSQVAQRLGDYERAMDTVERSIQIHSKLKPTQHHVNALNQYADVLENLGRYGEAEAQRGEAQKVAAKCPKKKAE